MSQINHTDELVTKQDLKDFYDKIYPYLNTVDGAIGVGGGYAPIGTIISYMGTTAPQDYLVCDGSTYNIADYKQLSDFFAAQFGSANFFGGDGITTFKVPDLRGEFLRGTGTNSHANQGSGANVGVHQDGTKMPDYASDDTRSYMAETDITNQDVKKRSGARKYIAYSSGDEYGFYFTSRPTNTSILYCIKAVVAGDVYSETERVVGTWIDGKPIYQKTVTLTMPTTALDSHGAYVGTSNLNVSSLGISQLVSLSAVHAGDKMVNCNQYFGYAPNNEDITAGLEACMCWYSKTANKILVRRFSADSVNDDAGVNVYVTVRYTKTTD